MVIVVVVVVVVVIVVVVVVVDVVVVDVFHQLSFLRNHKQSIIFFLFPSVSLFLF